MPARVTLKTVLSEMQGASLRFWKALDGNKVIKVQEEDLDLSESCALLQEFVESLEGDYVSLEMYSKSGRERAKGGKDYQKRDYTIKLNADSYGRGKNASGLNDSLLNRIVNLEVQLERERSNAKLAEMQRQIEDIRSGNTSTVEKVLGALPQITPHLPGILGALGIKFPGAPSALAGPPETETETVDDVKVYRSRINNALKEMALIDNEYVLVLEALAHIAKEKPDMYHSYRPMLLQLKNS